MQNVLILVALIKTMARLCLSTSVTARGLCRSPSIRASPPRFKGKGAVPTKLVMTKGNHVFWVHVQTVQCVCVCVCVCGVFLLVLSVLDPAFTNVTNKF